MFKRLVLGIALFLLAQTAHAGYVACPNSHLSTMDACPSGKTGYLKMPTGAKFCSTGANASNYCYGGPIGANGDSGLLTMYGAKSTDALCIQAVPNCGVAAPGGVTARGKTGKITVSWDSSGGGTSFTLKRGTVSGTYGTTVASGITARTYDDTTVVNGTRYYYVVVATNSYGTSGNSSPAASAYALAKPSLNSATAGNAQVTLAWAAVANATGYTIKRATAPGGAYASVATGITGTSYVNTGLTNGTTYYYVISATNGTGPSESDNSVERSATPQAPIPSAPTGLTATAGDGQVSLSWNASSGAASYTVKRSTTSGSGYVAVPAGTGVTGTSFTDTGLTNGTIYYYVVVAANASGTSGNSVQASATPLAAPAAPANFAATPGNARADLSWDASPGATGYSVKRRTTPTGSATTIAVGNVTLYANTGLTNGTTYYFSVVATNSSGTSAESNQVSVVPTAPPSAPTGLTATPGDGQVSLSWSASSGATGYAVLRSTTSGGPYVSVAVTSGLSYTDPNLTNGTAYYYVVRATNGGGSSANSSQVSATPNVTPAAPANLRVTAQASGSITLQWDAASGATSYTVLRGTGVGGPYAQVAAGVSGTTYTNSGLSNGTTYYFVVRAVNSGGTSGNSNEVSATPAAAPATPTGLVVTGLTPNGAVLSWNAVPGATSYTLSRGQTSGGGYSPIAAATDITTTSFTDATLTNNTLYYYVVKAKNTSGTSADSAQVPARPIYTPTLTRAARTGRVVLSWNAPAGATGYSIKRSFTPNGTTTVITVGNVTTYTDTGRTNNTLYYYVIAASNATGTGVDSAQVSATPIAPPTNFAAAPGDRSALLSWTKTPGADTYDLRRSLTPTGVSTTPGLADVDSYVDNNLVNGTTYYYHLVAKNDMGTGRSDVSAQITVVPNIIPATPLNFRAVPGNAQVTLSWDASAGATSYKLMRSLTPNGVTTTISLGNVTTYTNTGLTNGTAYYYVVVAVTSAGTSPQSTQVSATPQVPSSIILTLAPTPSRCSQKTVPSSTGAIEVKGSLAVSGGFPPYTVAWAPTPAWKSPAGAPLPFLATFRYASPVETFATTAPFPAITATVTDATGGTATVSRNLVPCANANACVMP